MIIAANVITAARRPIAKPMKFFRHSTAHDSFIACSLTSDS